MKYIENKEQFEQLLNEGPLVVDFYADWCGPCRMLGPVIEELAHEYEGKVNIVKLNVDKVEGIPEKYNIRSIPAVLFFKEGKEVNRIIGFRGKTDFENIIKSL